MAARAGRQIAFYWGGNSPADIIAGIKEKSVSLNGEPIDISSDESSGWRELLTIAGENQVNISISGVVKDRILITDWFAGTRTQMAQIAYPGGDHISGQFYIQSLSEGAPYNDASTFEAELVSTGTVTYSAS
jgi:TP901-1 family phage major tail protein